MSADNSNPESKSKSPLSGIISAIAVVAVLGASAYFLLTPAPDAAVQERAQSDPPVLVENVEMISWQETVVALGNVRANEQATLSPKVTERVTEVNFESGQQVKKGTLLIVLNDAEQQALLEEMQASLDERSRQLDRVKSVEGSGALSRSVIDEEVSRFNVAKSQLELAKARLDDRYIYAPFDGMLGLKNVSPGVLVQAGDPLVTIIDLTPAKVDFTIPERHFAQVQPGMPIRARAEAYPDRVFEGVVRSVSPQIDPISRAAQVRAFVPNKDLALRPGMLLNVELNLGEKQAMTIPESALSPIGDQQFVYRLDDANKAERVSIKIGRRQKGLVEVIEGLETGQPVVTHGHRVREGQTVQILTEDQVFKDPSES